MRNKLKYLTGTLLILFSSCAFSQINTYSPYSRFGIGQLTKTGLGQNSAMGTSGIALRTKAQINYINPAAYTAIDTNSFVFDFGISGSSTNYSSDQYHTKLNNFNIQHLAIGFPVDKMVEGRGRHHPLQFRRV